MTNNITKQRHGKLYDVWTSMKSRCLNPSHHAWENYGGRGITVCSEWMEFQPFKQWAMLNGYEDGLILDREDNELSYTPRNCRFVDWTVSQNNTRRNLQVTAFGETKTLAEWSKDIRCVVKYSTVWMRIQEYREDPESAMSRPSERVPVLAFGEYKTVTEWSKDPRCTVKVAALRQRIRQNLCDTETAITCSKLPKLRNRK